MQFDLAMLRDVKIERGDLTLIDGDRGRRSSQSPPLPRGARMGLATMTTNFTNFVEDGHERACKAIEAKVRAEVESQYADLWNASSLIGRWFLQSKIDREVASRVSMQAPPEDALY